MILVCNKNPHLNHNNAFRTHTGNISSFHSEDVATTNESNQQITPVIQGEHYTTAGRVGVKCLQKPYAWVNDVLIV